LCAEILKSKLPDKWTLDLRPKCDIIGRSHCLWWDFALLDDQNALRGLIEWDGEQHFRVTWFHRKKSNVTGKSPEMYLRRQMARDWQKEEEAKRRDIPLVRFHGARHRQPQFVRTMMHQFITDCVAQGDTPSHFLRVSDPELYASVWAKRTPDMLALSSVDAKDIDEDLDDDDDCDDDIEDDDDSVSEIESTQEHRAASSVGAGGGSP